MEMVGSWRIALPELRCRVMKTIRVCDFLHVLGPPSPMVSLLPTLDAEGFHEEKVTLFYVHVVML